MIAIADHDTLMKFAKRAAMQRPAEPHEMAQMIFWLLSDHNTFATAGVSFLPYYKKMHSHKQIFNVDGGWK